MRSPTRSPRRSTKFRAKAGGGIVLDIETGEVLALVSLPDFNPNAEEKNFTSDQTNKMTSGVFELGSVIKAVTFAMAFDYGVADLEDRFDARSSLIIGNARIDDFHARTPGADGAGGLHQFLQYRHRQDGAAKSASSGIRNSCAGSDCSTGCITELPESAKPLLPRRWSKLATATAAFGHGFAVQPLQGAAVVAGLLNGGKLITPTFIKRGQGGSPGAGHAHRQAGNQREVALSVPAQCDRGHGGKADAIGYRVGGKTGTAEKVINGRYSSEHRLTSFIGAFPMEAPRYLLLVMLDEPQALPETYGYATAGWNAVPTAGTIIERIAPLLGVAPVLTPEDVEKLAKQAQAGKKEG